MKRKIFFVMISEYFTELRLKNAAGDEEICTRDSNVVGISPLLSFAQFISLVTHDGKHG